MEQDASGEGEQVQAELATNEAIVAAAEAAVPILRQNWATMLAALGASQATKPDPVEVQGWQCVYSTYQIDRWYNLHFLAAHFKGTQPVRPDQEAFIVAVLTILGFTPDHIKAAFANRKVDTLVMSASVVRNDGRPMTVYEYMLLVPEWARQQVDAVNALKLDAAAVRR